MYKRQILQWSDEASKCFDELKNQLIQPPILAFPTETDTWILDTDASFIVMGALISQVQKRKECVIEYASKKITKTEVKYCITHERTVSYLYILKQFRHYILGRRFKISTDHKALTWLLNWENPSTSQYCRWIAEIEQYDFEIEHRKGIEHTNTDFMSKVEACGQCKMMIHQEPKKKGNAKFFNINTEKFFKECYY